MFPVYLKNLREGQSYSQPGAPDGLDEFATGYGHWLYHLLPGLLTTNPNDDDFEIIWSAWTRRLRRGRPEVIEEFPWDSVEEAIKQNIHDSLDIFIEDNRRNPTTNEYIDIASESTRRGLGLFKSRRRSHIVVSHFSAGSHELIDKFSQYIDVARGNMRDTGICYEDTISAQYNSPLQLKRDRGLEVMKRQLNFLALDQAGYNHRSIASGCFSIDELPYGRDPLINVYSRKIIDRSEVRENSGDPHAFLVKLSQNDVAGEIRPLQRDLQEARDTLLAVQSGWFPAFPENSEHQKTDN